jgi:hypothetical protein
VNRPPTWVTEAGDVVSWRRRKNFGSGMSIPAGAWSSRERQGAVFKPVAMSVSRLGGAAPPQPGDWAIADSPAVGPTMNVYRQPSMWASVGVKLPYENTYQQ